MSARQRQIEQELVHLANSLQDGSDTPTPHFITLTAAVDLLRAKDEEIDLLRARSPRAYIMTRKSEWLRMFREAIGYLHACRRQHHGTDREGRNHLVSALEEAMRELGEPEGERRSRVLAELNADSPA
jgi:hypothetical protein